MKKYLLTLLLLSFTMVAGADEYLKYKGYLLDQNTKTPLINAYIELVGEDNLVVTDENGFFEVKVPSTGRHILEISYIGYKTLFLPFESSLMSEKPEDIFLASDVEELDEVVVTSSLRPIKKRESPVVVSTMTTELFEALSATDLTQGLNYNSGLRVESTCQNCGFPQLRINGLEGTYTQILIDSRPVMGAVSGVYSLEQIPMNIIDKIEIIKGGGSTLFGSNAIAGVVNVITKVPTENFASLSSTYSILGNGSHDFVINGNGGIISKNERNGVTLFANHRERSAYDRDGDGYSEIGQIKANSFGFNGYSKLAKKGNLKYEYNVINEKRRGGNKLDLAPDQADIAEFTDYTINTAGATYDQFFGPYKHKLSIYSSFQNVYRDSYYGAEQDPNAYGQTTEIVSLSGVQMSHSLNRFLFAPSDLIYGAEFRLSNLDDTMLGYNRNVNQSVRQWSGFVQNQWNTKKVNILIGARLESHNLIDKPIFAPRANVLYKANDMFSFRASYANGFKGPEIFNEDLHVSLVGGEASVVVLADDLKPERSNSFSGSWEIYAGDKDLRTEIVIDGFYTKLNNVFVLTPTDSGDGLNTYTKENGDGAFVGGINLDGTLYVKDYLQFKLGYTFQKSEYDTPYYWSEDPTVAPTTKRLRSPEHYGYMSLMGYITNQFSATLNGTFTGSMLVPHCAGYIENDVLEKSKSFYDLGVKLAYDIKIGGGSILQVSAGVKNIFDSFQNDFDKGVNRDSKYVYGPTLPRTYYFGVKFDL